jgi:hypothetical protein
MNLTVIFIQYKIPSWINKFYSKFTELNFEAFSWIGFHVHMMGHPGPGSSMVDAIAYTIFVVLLENSKKNCKLRFFKEKKNCSSRLVSSMTSWCFIMD